LNTRYVETIAVTPVMHAASANARQSQRECRFEVATTEFEDMP
jgi:hypothetical protein